MRAEYEFKTTNQGQLQTGDLSCIVEFLKNGGLCVLPSDSSYILTGAPTVQGITKDIDTLLLRSGIPMSLTFSSLEQADDLLGLSFRAKLFINRLTPGPLTFIVEPNNKDMRSSSIIDQISPDGTIGVRLTESPVETQLVASIGYPLPTTPIRRVDGSEVGTAAESFSIISARVPNLPNQRKLAIIDGVVPNLGDLSTVVKESSHDGAYRIEILYERTIKYSVINKTALDCGYEKAVIV